LNNDNILFDLKNERRRVFEELTKKKELKDNALAQLDGFEELRAADRKYLFDEFKIVSDLEKKANAESKNYYDQHDPVRAKMYSSIRKGYTAIRLNIKQFQNGIKEDKLKLREYCQEKEAGFKKAQEDYRIIIKKIEDRERFLSDEQKKKSQYHESIVRLAGIPEEYLDNYKVITNEVNGYHHIYFGGEGTADGIGHGHYCYKNDGETVKCREAAPKSISA